MEDAADRIVIKEDARLMRGYSVTEYSPVPTKGMVIKDSAFLSTSTDCGIAERYSRNAYGDGVVMHIDVPKGTRALPGAYLTGIKEEEKEIFLMPNQEIYIKKVTLRQLRENLIRCIRR
ncbi:MAG: hypothetical protein LBS92_00730 [Candidatus Methanoplasma sp.]|jgi:hypothetical protein|nr:hypothetical protein [Candidatus Methanoplasma sp.]